MRSIQRLFLVALCALPCVTVACSGGRNGGLSSQEETGNDVVINASAQTEGCLPGVSATSINRLVCDKLDGGCVDESLECRPHTGLCMPKEDVGLTPCAFDEDETTDLCAEGYKCAAGTCIADTVLWNGPRTCVFDSDCVILDEDGEAAAGSTRCNQESGGYCLAECTEGQLCADGSECGCDGRCPGGEAEVTLYRPTLQVYRPVLAYAEGAEDYAPKAIELTVSLDSRAFGTSTTYSPGNILVLAGSGLVVAAQQTDPLSCVTNADEVATAELVKECVIPVTLSKQESARSASSVAVWVQPRAASVFAASQLRVVAPWASPESASVGVRIMGTLETAEEDELPEAGDQPVAGIFSGHAILSPAAFIEDYGQKFTKVTGLQIPIVARMGERTDPVCDTLAGICTSKQPFEIESESGVLGQPKPLRLQLDWEEHPEDPSQSVIRLMPNYGNVWTEAALAYAYREGTPDTDAAAGELQRFEDTEIALPIEQFQMPGDGAWWVTADGTHVEGTTELYIQLYPTSDPVYGVVGHAVPVRLDLFLDYEQELDVLPDPAVVQHYDKASLSERPFQTEVGLFELVAGTAAADDSVAACFSDEGRANLRTSSDVDVAFECAQRMLCYRSDADTVRHFGTSILPRSGELACGEQAGEMGRWEALPLFAGFGEQGEDASVGELLKACYQELSQPFLETLRNLTPVDGGVSQLEQLFANNAQCVDLARFYAAIAAITAEYGPSQDVRIHSMQYYNANRTGYDDSRAKRLLHRLLAQWIKLHSFVARETLSEAALLAVFSADPYAADLVEAAEGVPSLEQALELMERSWSLLLHPALARPMAPNRTLALSLPPDGDGAREAYLYPEYLRSPDYRVGVAANLPERPQYDQDVGLPVFIMEGLTAHFELLEAHLREVAEAEYASCSEGGPTSKQEAALSHFGAAIRYALVLEQLARDYQSVSTLAHTDELGGTVVDNVLTTAIADDVYTNDDAMAILVRDRDGTWGPHKVRSLEPSGVPPWQGRWLSALEEFSKARDRTTAVAQGIADCSNALSISDRDTPLFFGDPAGASSRYFAASDYLLNTWALPAVQSAKSRLNAAREAWMSETRTRVQEISNEFDYARRIEQLKESYGKPVADICGLSMSSQDVFDYFSIPPGHFDNAPTYGFAFDSELEGAHDAFKAWVEAGGSESPQEDAVGDDLRYAGGLLPGNCHIVRSQSCNQTLNRIWQETAPEGEEYYSGSCQDQAEYSRLTRAKVQEELCRRAYSMSEPERGELSLGNVTKALSDIFEAQPITYTEKFAQIGDGTTVFGKMSDSEIATLAEVDNPTLEGLRLVNCNKQIAVDTDNDGTSEYEVDTESLFDPGTTVFRPQFQALTRWRDRLITTMNGNVPKTDFSVPYMVVRKGKGNSEGEPIERQWTPTDRLLKYHSLMSEYTSTFCNDGDGSVELFGTEPWCNHSWDEHVARRNMGTANEPEDRAEEVATGFFNRVDRYCSQYAERRYVTNTMSFEGPSYELLNPVELASCLGGRLGGADIEILMARQRVRMAETALRTLNASIFIRTNNCIYKKDAGEERLALIEARDRAQEESQAQITQIQGSQAMIGHVFAAANGMFSGAVSTGEPWGAAAGGLLSLGSSVLEADTNAKIADVEAAHLKLDNQYSEMIAALSEDEALADCWLSVALVKEEVDDQIETIRHELLGVANALQQRDQLVQQVGNTLRDGISTVARETERKVPSLEHHFWVSEHIDEFHREMRWAKRLAYLAARAVEYEFQQSLNVRSMILQAKHPNELESALLELQREQASRTINRNRPEDDVLVLSTRDDLLDANKELGPLGSITGTENRIVRLREQILSGQNAVYDRSGNYLGQGLRIYLSPRGELNYRCGERLWRVSASLQGDGLGVQTPDVPVFLLKQNTFKSQWCEGRAEREFDYEDGDQFQYGHLQPSAQLFRPDGSTSDGEGIDAYSWASLSAQINTPKSEFYRTAYQEGGSEEFAGRGLYGEYILLLPWYGLIGDGFVLENIEDVLLRFDYLSVSNGPGDVTFP